MSNGQLFGTSVRSFDPSIVPPPEIHRLLVGGVAPRPIAFVATRDLEGRDNLSPFSFFNVFGVNPAVCCFSPAFFGKTGKPKHSMLNLDETKECTISVVNYAMIHQVSLASALYERGVDEFVKSGFTKRPSVKVAPPGVAESPFIMEAKLLHHLDFGKRPGSANMMVCEIVMVHVHEEIIDDTGRIDPRKIDQVARLGGDYYTRAREGLFQWAQPTSALLGIDRLPEPIRTSSILTGSDLAKLATVESFDESHEYSSNLASHAIAKKLLGEDKIDQAWESLQLR